jgi:hypothetical protein
MIYITPFLILICLVAMATIVFRRVRRKRIAAIIVVLAALVFVGAAFVIGGLPDFVGMTEERITVSMLNHRADRTTLERWFRVIAANWQVGQRWESGNAYTTPEGPCRAKCDQVVQVAFPHWFGFCMIDGDRITMGFDAQGRLTSWSVEAATDAC